jgi:predicted nucleotidyltransferase
MKPLRSLVDANNDQIRDIVRDNHGCSVAVFGSVARGEENADSDIDLLVEFDEGASLFDQVRIGQAVAELVGRRVDVVSVRALLPEDDDIRADAVAL